MAASRSSPPTEQRAAIEEWPRACRPAGTVLSGDRAGAKAGGLARLGRHPLGCGNGRTPAERPSRRPSHSARERKLVLRASASNRSSACAFASSTVASSMPAANSSASIAAEDSTRRMLGSMGRAWLVVGLVAPPALSGCGAEGISGSALAECISAAGQRHISAKASFSCTRRSRLVAQTTTPPSPCTTTVLAAHSWPRKGGVRERPVSPRPRGSRTAEARGQRGGRMGRSAEFRRRPGHYPMPR